jgi:hypothetical protein
MPISIEEVYIAALKKQMKKWQSGVIQRKGSTNSIQEKETPEHVMSTIKTFLFNETLYTEITKAALLMCDGPEKPETKIQELIAYVHTLITNDTDILKAWDIVKNHFRYDDENNLVWIDLGTIPGIVQRRGLELIRDRSWGSVTDTGVQGISTRSTVDQRRWYKENTVGVAVYFMDSSDKCFAEYTIPPISNEESIGNELKAIVPFKNWEILKVRNEINEDDGKADEWEEVYDAKQIWNWSTIKSILSERQRNILALKEAEKGTNYRLGFYLKIKKGYEIPKNISGSSLYRKIEPGESPSFQQSSAALLDKLKMLTDELRESFI